MSIQKIVLVVGLSVVAAAGWRFGQSPTFQRWIAADAPSPPPAFQFDNGSARMPDTEPDPEAAPASAARLASGLHKCIRGSQVVYTDGNCPPGTKEQDMTRGTVTVVPGQAPVKTTATTDTEPRRKNIRDVLAPPEANSLKDKRMEQVIGK
jgi:hypothetical protein